VSLALLLEGTTRAFFFATGRDIEVWRHFTPTRLPRLAVSDPLLGWRLLPGVARNVLTSEFQLVYRTNRHGLREVEIAPAGRATLMFLGDSQTFGEGVEIGQRFSDIVGQRLGVFSINAGVPGWGLHQMVDWFVLEGHRLRPDFVACTPIEGDLERALFPVGGGPGAPQVLIDPEEYASVPESLQRLARRADRLLRHSYLYAFFGARVRIALLRQRLAERDRRVWAQLRSAGAPGAPAGDPAALAPFEGAEGAAPVSGSVPAEDLSDPRQRLVRATTARLLLRLRDAVRDSGAQLVLAPIDDHPLPWLERIAAENAVPYLDASTALRGHTGVRHEIDPHYTAKGHALLAETLATGLAERLDLARRSPGPSAAGRAALAAEGARLRRRVEPRGGLPPDAFRAAWEAPSAALALRPGEGRTLVVRVRNASPVEWPAGVGALGVVRLGHRWDPSAAGSPAAFGTRRAELPAALAPGDAAEIAVDVRAPEAPGDYHLQFDLVCEGQAWFGTRGSPTLALPVRVR
jgi:hypothetical protein